MLKATLILSAVYLAIVGLALMIVPLQFGVGAVPADSRTVSVRLPSAALPATAAMTRSAAR